MRMAVGDAPFSRVQHLDQRWCSRGEIQWESWLVGILELGGRGCAHLNLAKADAGQPSGRQQVLDVLERRGRGFSYPGSNRHLCPGGDAGLSNKGLPV